MMNNMEPENISGSSLPLCVGIPGEDDVESVLDWLYNLVFG